MMEVAVDLHMAVYFSNLLYYAVPYPALPPEDYDDVSEKRNSLSFVIINPSCDLRLEEGDIVYVALCINIFSKLI